MTPASDTILVTGGAGQLGTEIARELAGRYRVRSADLLASTEADESLECDVREIDAVRRAVAGVEAVCHLAGLDFGRAKQPEEYVAVNVVGTWNVLQAAAEAGCRKVVLASSLCSYGLLDAPGEWTPLYLPIDEQHPQRPYAPYSASKAMIEEAGRTWARAAGLEVVALQPMHVVSPAGLAEYLRFIAAADPGWLHQYVTLEDTAAAFRHALETPIAGYDSFLIGAEDSPLAEPTLEWYAERVGPLPTLRPNDAFRRHPRAALFSSAKAERMLGWRAERRLTDLGQEQAPRAADLAVRDE